VTVRNLAWQKSTYSGDSSNCVYVAAASPSSILLRESDEPEERVLKAAPAAVRQFLRSLK
jgi:hypothetical protein